MLLAMFILLEFKITVKKKILMYSRLRDIKRDWIDCQRVETFNNSI